MSKPPPSVTIGLPVYNGENYLAESLGSLCAQTYRDLEIVISDNASTDGTERICREIAEKDSRVRYFRNSKNLGAMPNYNAVLARARGHYFKWAAHDDILGPDFVGRAVAALEANPGSALAFTRFEHVDARGRTLRTSAVDLNIVDPDVGARALRFLTLARAGDDVFWTIFGVTRTELLRELGGLGEYVASDQVTIFRLALRGAIVQVPEVLFYRREHAEASSVKPRTLRERGRWYTNRGANGLVLPNWRLAREHMRTLSESRLGTVERMRCWSLVVLRFAGRWRRLGLEALSIPLQLLDRSGRGDTGASASRADGARACTPDGEEPTV